LLQEKNMKAQRIAAFLLDPLQHRKSLGWVFVVIGAVATTHTACAPSPKDARSGVEVDEASTGGSLVLGVDLREEHVKVTPTDS
jgi:hypothetical protein